MGRFSERMRRTKRQRVIDAATDLLTKSAVDGGRLIEAGFLAMLAVTYPSGVTDEQRNQLRMAFFGGAQHLLGAMTSVMSPDADITESDLRRMDLIHRELGEFIQEFAKAHGMDEFAARYSEPVKGNA
jgi:hypothetical protein